VSYGQTKELSDLHVRHSRLWAALHRITYESEYGQYTAAMLKAIAQDALDRDGECSAVKREPVQS
jgi:hypothetical protein